MPKYSRIICISNRLPITASEDTGRLEFRPSSGGLVTAMGPILRESRGVWIGWPGCTNRAEGEVREGLAAYSAQSEFELQPVLLDGDAISGFYQGFSNQIIWPLFHDLQGRCNFEPAFWSAYLRVQSLFRDAALAAIKPDDLLWVHDFHLMGLARSLRMAGSPNKLCFFLHIPFPCPDIFCKLPWRIDVIQSLLNYDLIGFQTERDLENFINCVEILSKYRCAGRGARRTIRMEDRECVVGSFPISIDCAEFEDIARSPEVESKAKVVRQDMNVEFLVLSIDRLDYTKGIPYRIKAFGRLLEREPALKKRVGLLQVVVPSRIEVAEYQQLRSEIEQLVSQVNGMHGEPGWVPVHHLFRSLVREDLIAMYRASDVALITPLRDGMNLVAKEYCVSRINSGGILVLSEFAGVADEFGDYSFLVNPYDVEGMADALVAAFAEGKDESRAKMGSLREIVKNADVYSWAERFLGAVDCDWRSINSGLPQTGMWARLRRLAEVFDI